MMLLTIEENDTLATEHSDSEQLSHNGDYTSNHESDEPARSVGLASSEGDANEG